MRHRSNEIAAGALFERIERLECELRELKSGLIRDASARAGGAGPRRGKKGWSRYILAGALLLAFAAAPLAVAGDGDAVRLSQRNPSSGEASGETEIIAENTTYGTRQSNKKEEDGGGAIYGCRSVPGKEPCVRANNLKTGRAFEFKTDGSEGGFIEVNGAGAKPFSTNATGVATGLNADQVDGKSGTDFVGSGDMLWAVVASDGSLSRNRNATGSRRTGAGVYEVDFNRNVDGCATVAAISDTASSVPARGIVVAASRAAAGAPNSVAVDVFDPFVAGVPVDRPFHLGVLC